MKNLRRRLRYLLIILIVLLISACSIFKSAERKAQDKLKDAIALDPSIFEQRTTDTVVKTIHDTTIIRDSIVIIPKVDSQIDLGNPCDTSGLLKPFDYSYNQGGYRVRVWGDSTGVHVKHGLDSIIQRNKELERRLSEKQTEIKEVQKVVRITQYRTITWQLIAAGIFGFFVGLIPTILRHVLKKAIG